MYVGKYIIEQNIMLGETFGRAKMARDFVTLYTVYRNSSKLRISLQLFL